MWDTRGITRSRQTTHDLQKSVYPFSSPHVWHHIPPGRRPHPRVSPFVVAWKLFIYYVFKTPSGFTSAALPLPHKLYIFNIITSRMYICVQPLSWWIYMEVKLRLWVTTFWSVPVLRTNPITDDVSCWWLLFNITRTWFMSTHARGIPGKPPPPAD